MSLGMTRVLEYGYGEALARIPEALKTEGFGVLTEIDVQATLKQKLGVEFRRYKILGACNPPIAHQALRADLEVGVMLPCNVVVYEREDGRAVVIAVDPTQTAAAREIPAVQRLAGEVKGKLARVLARLG
jgi:uncharacterized protein (DUF302 family)